MGDGIETAEAAAEAAGGGGAAAEATLLWATYAGGTAVRPMAGATYKCLWICTTAAVPPVVTSGTAGRYAGDIVSMVV